MKTITRTENVGEELGPVDWSHPMVADLEKRSPQLVATLREAEQNPEAFEATTDGGWPRVGWGKVIRVVMYDGWPYWQPTPTVVSLGWYGVRYDQFDSLSDVRRAS